MPTPTDTPSTSYISGRRLFSVVVVMLLSLAISGSYLVYQAREDARIHTLKQGQQALRQYAILLQPLMLSDDKVSMNYLLSELVQQPHINALTIRSGDGEIIARAGEDQGLTRNLELERGGRLLGKITLWLSPEPIFSLLRQQLLHTLGLALSLVLAVVITLRHTRKPSAQPEQDTTQSPSFDQILEQAQPSITPQALDPLEEALHEDELPLEEEEEQEAAQPPVLQNPQDDGPLIAETTDEARHEPPLATPATEPQASSDSKQTDELVSLLRPDKTERMPRFIPSVPQSDDDEIPLLTDTFGPAKAQQQETPVPDIRPEPLAEKAVQVNPLLQAASQGYSIDDDLELVIPPDQAGYLLLIDSTSGHAEYVEEDERRALLGEYQTLAEQCAQIYKGELEVLESGDLHILFSQPGKRDEHGINALCAATLFTLAYRQFNQNRIRSFEPVLNLHMALVRGKLGDNQLLADEARHLAHTTHSNALISHTALTEASLLKRSLLKEADIRREDEDKVLIQSLNTRYQALLERQASHLLQ